MKNTEKYYIGIGEFETGTVFCSDNPQDATPEYSGFDVVDGPFDTEEEAEANCP